MLYFVIINKLILQFFEIVVFVMFNSSNMISYLSLFKNVGIFNNYFHRMPLSHIYLYIYIYIQASTVYHICMRFNSLSLSIPSFVECFSALIFYEYVCGSFAPSYLQLKLQNRRSLQLRNTQTISQSDFSILSLVLWW